MGKIRKSLIIILILLFISSIVFLLFEDKIMEIYLERSLPKISGNGYNQNVENNNKEKVGLAPTYNAEESEPLSTESIAKYYNKIKYTISKGRIIIPSVNIDIGIYEGINNEHLLVGAAEQYPRNIIQNGQIGNYVLASHMSSWNPNYNFTGLERMKIGDKIYTTDREYMYIYKTKSSKVYHKSDTTPINEKSDTEAIITLYTCYNPKKLWKPDTRRVIQGTLINKIPLEDIQTISQEISL